MACPKDITAVPPPWTLRGTAYVLPFWVPSAQTTPTLPALARHPLEAAALPASASDRPTGGLGFVQVIRYTESPVGPYDELILAPGPWEFDVEGSDGRRAKRKNARITRIYVSQKQTCWNGRTNWNICKHLARFDFKTENNQTTVAVYPFDTDSNSTSTSTSGRATGASLEASASRLPFFKATFSPVAYTPAFPLNMSLASAFGIDITLAHPPLPAGPQPELAATSLWRAVYPQISSKRARLVWCDRRQDAERAEGVGENFWPGWGRWGVGVVLEDALFEFAHGESWEPVRSAE